MNLKASDLPPSIKDSLLESIRTRLGESEYNRLSSDLGEDELLDAFLASDSRTETKPPFKPWSDAFDASTWFLNIFIGGATGWPMFIVGFIWWCIFAGPLGAAAVFLLSYAAALVFFFICNFTKKVGLRLVMYALVGTSAAAGLWFGFPWIASGIRQWWTWLGGHF
ncbi:MAG: hypothetical protein L0Y58_03105 [Verrucomicrobia subdivision 3 bacterium]|nr:hypothetical protein [Limisphaerales bacterium]